MSETDYQNTQVKADMVLDICQKFNADDYVSPAGSKKYMTKSKNSFIESKINVFYQDYKHPTYKQLGKKFIPNLGIFDLLYNNGFTKSLDVIRSGCKHKIS